MMEAMSTARASYINSSRGELGNGQFDLHLALRAIDIHQAKSPLKPTEPQIAMWPPVTCSVISNLQPTTTQVYLKGGCLRMGLGAVLTTRCNAKDAIVYHRTDSIPHVVSGLSSLIFRGQEAQRNRSTTTTHLASRKFFSKDLVAE